MKINEMIYKLRNEKKMSQEQFAALFDMSKQVVQKWENGTTVPELKKIVEISKFFGVSLDNMIFGHDNQTTEEMKYNKKITPQYSNINDLEFYASNLLDEYQQCIDEGLDVEKYENVFKAVAELPKNEIKKKFGDILFDIVINAEQVKEYKYDEPSELREIKLLRKEYVISDKLDKLRLKEKIHGAWIGRICGCMLGKTVEGIKSDELVMFLKESNNYPMHRYIYRGDVTDETLQNYNYCFANRDYADEIDGMPVDDDTNYVVLAQIVIENYGKDFTPQDVSRVWMNYQKKDAYWTAEKVAFCNFINGYEPPESAVYKNPFREWIGAQIRGDYFGYVNPGNPEMAAEMAWRDASISHVKNGIYGEMFVAAMLAIAAVTNDIEKIILGGLAQIPHTSRLYEAIMEVLNDYKNNVSQKDCFKKIHKKFDEYSVYGWTHTISNAMIVVASLLYGDGDYGKSICMAVETGFDTDCNGATVGSVLGMANGMGKIPEYWYKPVNDILHTTIFGVGTVKISDRVNITMEHIEKFKK